MSRTMVGAVAFRTDADADAGAIGGYLLAKPLRCGQGLLRVLLNQQGSILLRPPPGPFLLPQPCDAVAAARLP